MKARLPWALAVPPALAGVLVAHALAYRLVAPDPHVRAHLLAESGHGYLRHAPLVAAALAALAVLAFAARVAGRGRASAPPFTVGLVPPLAFVLQEHLERAVQHGAVEWSATLEPTFVVGLVLQLPFALVAALVAGLLAGAADRLAQALAPVPPRPWGAAVALRVPVSASPPLPSLLALCAAQRGPPPPLR